MALECLSKGTIPAEFGRLHQLKRLRLNDNMLSGDETSEAQGQVARRFLNPRWIFFVCM